MQHNVIVLKVVKIFLRVIFSVLTRSFNAVCYNTGADTQRMFFRGRLQERLRYVAASTVHSYFFVSCKCLLQATDSSYLICRIKGPSVMLCFTTHVCHVMIITKQLFLFEVKPYSMQINLILSVLRFCATNYIGYK